MLKDVPRNQATLRVQCTLAEATRLYTHVPGVQYVQGGIAVSWDALPAVAHLLKRDLPEMPLTPLEQLPGYDAYVELLKERNIKPRDYQVSDAAFLANRSFAMLCNPMRSGKSLVTLLAAKLAGYARVLILCPSVSKWVWGQEIAKWTGEEALVLAGVSNSRAMRFCAVCHMSGRAPDGSRCPACKQRNGSTYGYHLVETRKTEPPTKKQAATGDTQWRCRKHPHITSPADMPERCSACREEMRKALTETPYVVVNYDVLSCKSTRDLRGRVTVRADMPGWSEALSLLDFDLVIIDESHYLRGFDTSYRRRGKMMYDRVREMVARIPNVWMATGTPIFGMVRDLYGQFDVLTHGRYGDARSFTERYCAGHEGPHGWVATGQSNEEELKARLDTFMVARPRSEILASMPPKQRTVQYIENEVPVRRRKSGKVAGQLAKLIDAAALKKHPAVIENVVRELSEGMKVYVLTFRPKHAERLANQIAKTMNKREWRSRMRSTNAEVFRGQTAAGIDPRRRAAIAKSYCDHQGAAVFIATIRSMPGSISLKGTQTVHMVDFDTSPSSMEQAEDRGYEPGITGYAITHYVLKNSIDDDLAAVVIPKFETKDRIMADENAANVLAAFTSADDAETLDEVMTRHTAHLEFDDDDDEI